MSTLLPLRPNTVLSPFQFRPRTQNPLLHKTHFGSLPNHRNFLRGDVGLVRFGFKPGLSFPDPDEGLIGNMFEKFESLVYTIADAAVSSSETVVSNSKQSSDWLSGITYYMESVLKVLKDGLSVLHVPYSYGFAIILLTVLVKAATFPLSKKQVESAMAMRSLQPQIKAIQERYAGDQERIQLETVQLYRLAGINPLAGCLPTLATIPVWIGLYRALSNVADEGLLTEGFFWIPSLSGPTTIASRQSGSGISWLFPFVDGHPPLGWSDTLAYLVLPTLLVLTQYISMQIMQSSQANDPNVKSSQALTKVLPLMIGYFALSQVWLQKLGGAKYPVRQFSDDIIKEQSSEIPKSSIESNMIRKQTQQEEISPSTGLRPGERFKLLKEQEARRRQQREEEKRKAEEAAALGMQSTKNGTGLFEMDVSRSKLVDGGNESIQASSGIDRSSENGQQPVNGTMSSQSLEEDQKTSSHVSLENELSSSIDMEGREEQFVLRKSMKSSNKLSGEEASQARTEESSKREDA
ncbi:Membrane insertase YidC/ALB3/OXA1/COX18 [Dillenia turbinata]|uniref:Membrane insertase YidC/ALB3/OXA1/COX18 n=1 Tax=Dillenia turbinata TaxID=194707 RepID=A0AAN8UUX2_9MAGN